LMKSMQNLSKRNTEIISAKTNEDFYRAISNKTHENDTLLIEGRFPSTLLSEIIISN